MAQAPQLQSMLRPTLHGQSLGLPCIFTVGRRRDRLVDTEPVPESHLTSDLCAGSGFGKPQKERLAVLQSYSTLHVLYFLQVITVILWQNTDSLQYPCVSATVLLHIWFYHQPLRHWQPALHCGCTANQQGLQSTGQI